MKTYILGSGGLAREIYGWIVDHNKKAQKKIEIEGFLILDDASEEQKIYGKDCLNINNLNEPFYFIVGIGVFEYKLKGIQKALRCEGSPLTFIHHSVSIGEDVSIGEGCVINPRSSVSSGAKISDFVLINCDTGVGHDASIGSYSTIFGNVAINGNVSIGENVEIASGVTIYPGVKIDNNSKCGVGSIVIRNVKENQLVLGYPAKNRNL
tara:strand:- start:2399 stop:3025 length:627 start_codon:yes stop_codon:yes gene_type:complete